MLSFTFNIWRSQPEGVRGCYKISFEDETRKKNVTVQRYYFFVEKAPIFFSIIRIIIMGKILAFLKSGSFSFLK